MARPRTFNETEVLDRAMQVFSAYGYEGASMAALTAAMGLTAPSIYAAFQSKRGLFEAVINHHVLCEQKRRDRVLSQATARAVAEAWLLEAAAGLVNAQASGTLLIAGGLAASPENQDVPGALARRRQANELALWDRFAQAKASGDLPAGADPAGLAAFIATVHDGMAVRAASGATLADLQAIARQAMKGWPTAGR